VNCPDTIQEWAGFARRQVQVNLVSTTPTRQVGEEEVLMITTRGLCCCASEQARRPMDEFIVAIKGLPRELVPARRLQTSYSAALLSTAEADPAAGRAGYTAGGEPAMATAQAMAHAHETGMCAECAGKVRGAEAAPTAAGAPAGGSGYTIRQANELSDYIKTESLKSLNDPYAKPKRFTDTDFFAKQLEYLVAQTRKGRELLSRPGARHLPERVVRGMAERLRKDPQEVTVADVLALRGTEMAQLSGLSEQEVHRARLASLGVRFRAQPGEKPHAAPYQEPKKPRPGKREGGSGSR
jgi:hypothetical protein